MLNSRDISLLRDDVEANCRVFIDLCKDHGYSVLVTGTVRDDEYQKYCAENGLAAKTATRPTFHSVKAGLAFDICQNIKGQEYNDPRFWDTVLPIARSMGFTCGADWKSFPDKPHIQWDKGGTYSNTNILLGKYPPLMPLYKTKKKELKMDNVPSPFAADAVAWAIKVGILKGDSTGDYRLHSTVTREELITFMYRSVNE